MLIPNNTGSSIIVKGAPMKEIRIRLLFISSRQSARGINQKWSEDTKYPGLYLLIYTMHYFPGTIVHFLVPIDIFFDRANKQKVHAGAGHF